MDFDEIQDAKFKQMTEAPVPRLISRLAVPTIVSMLITSIYNMADTYFVSQIGTSASAAVGIVFSLMAIIQAVGFTLGMGSGNLVSRMLGQKDRETALRAASVGFFTALGVGVLIAVSGLLFIDQLVRLLGATDTIYPYAKDYAQYILIGAPYMTASFVLNTQLRSQGSAFFAMIGITAGGVLNIALDPIFIFGFGMGIGGAAIATNLSQLISFCILMFYSLGRRGNLPISIKHFKPSRALCSEIVRVGIPSFYRQGLASLSAVLLNVYAGPFGDAAIAAMTIVSRVMMFIGSALIGFGQGFQPVCGFNYGAKRYDRVLEAFWFCLKVALAALAALAVIFFLGAPSVMSLFRKGDMEVIQIGSLAMRLQCLLLPATGWVIMTNMLLQSIGDGRNASILAMSRQGLFFVPVIMALPPIIGILSVQLCQPAADICTLCLSLFIGTRKLRELASLRDAQGKTA